MEWLPLWAVEQTIMNVDGVVIRAASAGGYGHDIVGTEPAQSVFKQLWRLATDFAVVNSSVPVTSSSGGKGKKDRVKRQIAEFPVLGRLVTGALWVDKWPGTISSMTDRLLVTGRTSGVDYDAFFAGSSSLLWSAPGGWDDLMLIADGKLLFYVCTHEAFGQILGSRELFADLKLCAVPMPPSTWEIRGRKVDPDFHAELFGGSQ